MGNAVLRGIPFLKTQPPSWVKEGGNTLTGKRGDRGTQQLVNISDWAMLPRKEVIQPHLPVRLPCYDFVPVAAPALGRCLPQRGLAHGLQALATPMT